MSREPQDIGYLTDEPVRDYNAGLDASATPDELRDFLAGWPTLAPDAIEAARSIRPEDWAAFRTGLKLERRRRFAGEEWMQRYGAILMPGRMLQASVVAQQFHVPWGLAWIRLVETDTFRVPA